MKACAFTTTSLGRNEAVEKGARPVSVAPVGVPSPDSGACCNLAWGIIDGIMYLMACLSKRAQRLRTLVAVGKAANSEEAHRVIASALPPRASPVAQGGLVGRVVRLSPCLSLDV